MTIIECVSFEFNKNREFKAMMRITVGYTVGYDVMTIAMWVVVFGTQSITIKCFI